MNAENTWVYVWNLTADKVGHTAIQIGGCTPKTKLDNKDIKKTPDESVYISIHPGGIPAIGPTTVLPLPAILAKSLTDDMLSEAAAAQQPTYIHNSTQRVELQPPDQVFQIPLLNTQAMREHVRKVDTGVTCGDTSYQLLPRVKAVNFLRELPGYLAQDPVDMSCMRKTVSSLAKKNKEKSEYAVYNCATLVEKLLTIGGVPPIDDSRLRFPWDPTPNGVAEHLKALSFQASSLADSHSWSKNSSEGGGDRLDNK